MRDVLQFDDFAPDAKEIRDAIIAGEFSMYGHADGAQYRIGSYPVDHWMDHISKLVGGRVVNRLSGFRLDLAGELPKSWVHSDGMCAEYASVLYLNLPEQCAGGTAFWRHTALNVDRLQPKEELTKQGIHADWYYRMMEREWKDLTFWEQIGMAEMKFNRFVTYPTSLFHSRFPFEAFGSGPQDGRLVWVCFYDIERGGQV